MREAIAKISKRLKAQKGVDARKFMLMELLPLLTKMQEQHEASVEAADENFKGIFRTFDLVDDTDFMQVTKGLLLSFSTTVDKLCIMCGLLELVEGELVPTSQAPKEMLTELEVLGTAVGKWYEREERIAEMLDAEAEEDDDGFEDDGDGELEDESTFTEELANAKEAMTDEELKAFDEELENQDKKEDSDV